MVSGYNPSGVFAACLACGEIPQWIMGKELLCVFSIVLFINGKVYVSLTGRGSMFIVAVVAFPGIDQVEGYCIID